MTAIPNLKGDKWIYKGEESKLIHSSDVEKYYRDGWGDVPGFKKVGRPRVNK